MRLVTYTFRGARGLGALVGGGTVVDLNRAHRLASSSSRVPGDAGPVWPDMLALLEMGDGAMDLARAALDAATSYRRAHPEAARDAGLAFALDEPGFRLEAPVPRPGSVLAVGLNYRAHAEEAQSELPQYPMIFAKVATCVIGPGASVERPRVSTALDWEGELCVVIGKPARHVAAADALQYVAGYMNGNDVSVRDWQRHTPQFVMGKSFDTHGPTGPALVTRDEVPEPGNLAIRTWVNGELKQESNTRLLIFDIGTLIEYLTKAFTLQPGDVIFTGTPSGVGFTRQPPEALRPGDTVRVEVTGLGALENPVIDEPPP